MTAQSEWSQLTTTRWWLDDDGHDDAQIDVVDDILRVLARVPRYGGHGERVHSVAQHSVAVAMMLAEQGRPVHEICHGLGHDMHEALIGDWTRPVIRFIDARAPGVLDELSWLAQKAVALAMRDWCGEVGAFGRYVPAFGRTVADHDRVCAAFPDDMADLRSRPYVKVADNAVLQAEAPLLFKPPIEDWHAHVSSVAITPGAKRITQLRLSERQARRLISLALERLVFTEHEPFDLDNIDSLISTALHADPSPF